MNNTSCAKKSKNKTTNANCCIEKDAPGWCPDTSLNVIQANLKKMKSSLRARKLAKKLLNKLQKEIIKEESRYSNDPVATENRKVPNAPLGKFWWPFFCRLNTRCCTKCYLKLYSNVMNSKYNEYLHCIWRKCRYIPDSPVPISN